MVMPLLSIEAVRAIESRLGVVLPTSLIERIERHGAVAAWQSFEETVAALRHSGMADGLAIMSFEMDPAPEVGQRIITALQTAGIAIDPAVGDESISSG